MSSDATALPFRETPAGEERTAGGRGLPGGRANALARTSTEARVGALVLLTIVACSALVVLMAADRPSILSPTTHTSFFPHWMAGPLGGLWPGLLLDFITPSLNSPLMQPLWKAGLR